MDEIKTSLVVAFDVTGFPESVIKLLAQTVEAAGRDVAANHEVIEHDGDLDLAGVLHVGLGH